MSTSTPLPTMQSIAAAVANRRLQPHKKLATEMSQKEIMDLHYWKQLVPFLTISTLTKAEKAAYWRKQENEGEEGTEPRNLDLLQYKIKNDGYCVVPDGPSVESEAAEDLGLAGEPSAKRRKIEGSTNGSEGANNRIRMRNKSDTNEESDYKSIPILERLRLAAYILKSHGWPATFLAIYDEAWELAQNCQKFINHLTESTSDEKSSWESSKNSLPPWLLCFDVVGFFVENGKGFSPHRDRQPEDWQPNGHPHEDPRTTFTGDNGNGYAKYITCWVALEEASPASSCLYYVNARADSGYWGGDSNEEDGLEPMEAVFTNNGKNASSKSSEVTLASGQSGAPKGGAQKGGVQKSESDAIQEVINRTAFQHIRAAPVPKGGMVCHTHRVIHWGGAGDNFDEIENGSNRGNKGPNRGSKGSNFSRPPPRIALSFAFTNNVDSGVFEPPFFRNPERMLPFPEFEGRIALCCGQIINYSTLIIGDKEGWATVGGGNANTSDPTANATKSATGPSQSSPTTLGRQHLGRFYAIFQKNASKLFSPTYIREVGKKFVEVTMSKEMSKAIKGASAKGNVTKEKDEDGHGKGLLDWLAQTKKSRSSSTKNELDGKDQLTKTSAEAEISKAAHSKSLASSFDDDDEGDMDELALEAMLQNAVGDGSDADLGDDLDGAFGDDGLDDFNGDGFSDDAEDDAMLGKPEAWGRVAKDKNTQKKVASPQVSKQASKQIDPQQKGKHKNMHETAGVDHHGAGFKKYSKAERRAHNKELKAAKKESRMVRKKEAKAR